MEGYSYVMVDGDIINDVPDLCRINLIYSVPKNMTNMTYTDVHDILVYGFELSWLDFCCFHGKENRCNLDEATVKEHYCLGYDSFPETYCTYSSLSLSLSIYIYIYIYISLPQVLYYDYAYNICFILCCNAPILLGFRLCVKGLFYILVNVLHFS